MKKGDKKGISTIVVTVLLIVLALVLVAVAWAVINRLIVGNAEGISLDKLTINADIEQVGYNLTTNNISVLVKRNQGAGDVGGLRFVFYNSTETEFAVTNYVLEELMSRRFEFHLDMDTSTLARVAVVPIFKTSTGKETLGNIADTYFFRGTESGTYVPGD